MSAAFADDIDTAGRTKDAPREATTLILSSFFICLPFFFGVWNYAGT